MRTEMAATGEAVAAAAAHNVALSADHLAYGEIGNIGADGCHLTHEFMANG